MFTAAEQTNKRYCVQDAINAAKARLNANHPGVAMCMNPVGRYNVTDKITLAELNEIQDDLYGESVMRA